MRELLRHRGLVAAAYLGEAGEARADDEPLPVRGELFDAERATIVDLRRRGVIDDEVERRLYRELDLEDARLDV